MKKIQNKYDEVFKQLNSLNEKLIVIQKENMTLKDEIVLKDKKQNNTDNTIIELRQFIKQISDDNNTNENKHIKEIQKIKNKR